MSVAHTPQSCLSTQDPFQGFTHQGTFPRHGIETRENHGQRLNATLVADSLAEGPVLGVRSTQIVSRQMIYQAGDYNICLSLDYMNPSQTIAIMGQTVLLDADVGKSVEADIELLKEATVVCDTKSDEFGVFELVGIPEGIFDLRIRSKAEVLDITGLNVAVCHH